ncbi:MAG: cation diffusion facilitator family transporter [Bacteroidales bacterium]|nr:cation diffusion facilitator family transporter [Bacteroidales bacterium]
MNREKEIFKVTLVGSAANVLLTVFKFIAGVVGNSAAMVADAVHSLSDLLTDAIVLCFVRISGKPEDCGHDYGHGKYETLATTLIGIALSAVAIGIGYKAVTAFLYWLQGGMLATPGMLALWAAVVSIAIKELVYHYTVHKGRVLNSPAVEANAWHHRSDALSSIGTLVGIGGAILLGKRWTVLDPIASLVVSFFILRVAWKLLKQGLDELMEASLPEEVESEILAIVNTFPDVQDPHHLRTRRIGSRYAIELHIRMDGSTPLNIAHSRTYEIEQALKQHFGTDTHVTIHVEPAHKDAYK